jgi:putative sterol carrier protein
MEIKIKEFNDNPDLVEDIASLEGCIILLKTVEGGNYMVEIKEGKFLRAADAKPTIQIESSEEVMLGIVEGKIDPLEAMNSRKLVAKTDAQRGRILRRIFYGEDF